MKNKYIKRKTKVIHYLKIKLEVKKGWKGKKKRYGCIDGWDG